MRFARMARAPKVAVGSSSSALPLTTDATPVSAQRVQVRQRAHAARRLPLHDLRKRRTASAYSGTFGPDSAPSRLDVGAQHVRESVRQVAMRLRSHRLSFGLRSQPCVASARGTVARRGGRRTPGTTCSAPELSQPGLDFAGASSRRALPTTTRADADRAAGRPPTAACGCRRRPAMRARAPPPPAAR